MAQETVGVKTLPPELQKFSWGAFLLSWIWGIGNKSYLTMWAFVSLLICWIPFVNFVAPLGLSIWFGTKGNEWAWQNKEWTSVEHFNDVQKKWVIAGLIVLGISIVFSFMFSMLFLGAIFALGRH